MKDFGSSLLPKSRRCGPIPLGCSNVVRNGDCRSALVDIYFDSTDLCLASGVGAVSCAIKVPKDAQPQMHWIVHRRPAGKVFG